MYIYYIMYWSSNPKLFWTGKDFSSFVREAAEVDRNRCDGVDEGYAALRVAPNGVTGTVRWDESDGDDTYYSIFICVFLCLYMINMLMYVFMSFLLIVIIVIIVIYDYLLIYCHEILSVSYI